MSAWTFFLLVASLLIVTYLAAFARDWLLFVIIYYTLQSLLLFHRSLRCF